MTTHATSTPLRRLTGAFTFLLVGALSACGPVPSAEDAGDHDDDAGVPALVSSFAPEDAVGGPRLVLVAEDVTDTGATLVVRAHDLADVWGYTFHVDVGGLTLPLASAVHTAPALGDALSASHASFVRDTVVVVAARETRDEGVALVEDVELLRFDVTSDVGGTFTVGVARPFVRRAAGDVVVPAVQGGALTLVGGAP